VYDEKVSKLYNETVSTALLKNVVKTIYIQEGNKKFDLLLFVSERHREYGT
jgi:hypothetical protein